MYVSRLDLSIHVSVSCSYFFPCHVFKVLYRFWHIFSFIHTILTYSCIRIVLCCVLVIFRVVFNLCLCRIVVSCLVLPCIINVYNRQLDMMERVPGKMLRWAVELIRTWKDQMKCFVAFYLHKWIGINSFPNSFKNIHALG